MRRCGHAAWSANFRGTRKFPRYPPQDSDPLVLWRLLYTPPLDGPENMALDEALMARARRTGEGVLRTYSWSVPTLSLGRNQRARGLYDEVALGASGVRVVRRPTGGRALLHAREVTYSVTAPVAADATVGQSYARINVIVAGALESLGAPVRAATRKGRSASPTGLPCFAEPARGELEFEGRKLVGSAQWRDDGALLQHGSILVADDQSRIAAFMRVPTPVLRAPATLSAIVGRAPAAEELHSALGDALRAHVGDAAPLDLDLQTIADSARLAERYRDAGWTWRR